MRCRMGLKGTICKSPKTNCYHHQCCYNAVFKYSLKYPSCYQQCWGRGGGFVRMIMRAPIRLLQLLIHVYNKRVHSISHFVLCPIYF